MLSLIYNTIAFTTKEEKRPFATVCHLTFLTCGACRSPQGSGITRGVSIVFDYDTSKSRELIHFMYRAIRMYPHHHPCGGREGGSSAIFSARLSLEPDCAVPRACVTTHAFPSSRRTAGRNSKKTRRL